VTAGSPWKIYGDWFGHTRVNEWDCRSAKPIMSRVLFVGVGNHEASSAAGDLRLKRYSTIKGIYAFWELMSLTDQPELH
jgi:hypothetical protein